MLRYGLGVHVFEALETLEQPDGDIARLRECELL